MTYKVKCSLFLNILLFCLLVLTGCGEPKELTNSNGVIVKGGNFPEGSELVSREVSVVSAEGFAAIEVIKKVDYDKYSSVYIYDIHVLNNKNKVQPDEEVTITLPFKDDSFKLQSINDYAYLQVFSKNIDKTIPIINGNIHEAIIRYILPEYRFSAYDFTKALQEIKMWSDNNPNHMPVIIIVEPKSFVIEINGMKKFSLEYAKENLSSVAAAKRAGVALAIIRSTFLAVNVLITVVQRFASPAT